VESDEGLTFLVFHEGRFAYDLTVTKRGRMTKEAEAVWKAQILPIVRSALVYGLRGPEPDLIRRKKPGPTSSTLAE
jgi:hypothetical protein